jgi:catechol 2,3-dioxygenase-like lactoylglutathione lyase family enzyme
LRDEQVEQLKVDWLYKNCQGNCQPLICSRHHPKKQKMKMIPLFRCSSMKAAIAFYTGVLDFELTEPEASANDWVVLLKNGDAQLMLTILEGDQHMGTAANVLVQDIDALFKKYIQRGLDTSDKKDSPVHQEPLNQSWGTREFYVTDADGNTLRFMQPLG